MGICYIIAASDSREINPAITDDDLLIAADGGYEIALKNGLTPDIVLGDFDSLGFVPDGDNVVCLPVKKDDTDTLAAVKIGIEKGFECFGIYGGLGGRTDHTLANIQTLSFIADNGGRGYLIGDNESVTLIKNSVLSFEARAGGTVSVFAYGGKASGVSIKGLSYELYDRELNPSFPLGVSNEFCGNSAEIAVKDGKLLIVYENH